MQLTLVSVHCCELCALKQKPGVLLEKPISPSPSPKGERLCETTKITKSQLQTVLITASGPQALNALVHRERYTQGSRQNRCVSSQKALALRAKAVGTEATSADRIRARRLGYTEFRLCVPCERPALPARRLPSREVGIPHFSRSTVLASFGPSSQKLPTRNCLRRRIQLCN